MTKIILVSKDNHTLHLNIDYEIMDDEINDVVNLKLTTLGYTQYGYKIKHIRRNNEQ